MVFDTVVVGAGLAGLTAADSLAQRGLSVLVVEARGRVGGRTHTEQVGGRTVDFGGQYFGKHQLYAMRAAKDAELTLFPQNTSGKSIVSIDNWKGKSRFSLPLLSFFQSAKFLTWFARTEWFIRRLPSLPFAALQSLDQQKGGEGEEQGSFESDFFRLMCRLIFGANPSELSKLFIFDVFRSSLSLYNAFVKNFELRSVEGAQTISHCLAESIGSDRIVLHSAVARLQQDDDLVVVTHAKGTVKAKHVILTVPYPLLKNIQFAPHLPHEKWELVSKSSMGKMVKVIVRYDIPFWRKEGLSGSVITDKKPANFIFDYCDAAGKEAALVAHVMANDAEQWLKLAHIDRKRAIIDQLVFFFGPEAARAISYSESTWHSDPFGQGGAVIFPPELLVNNGHDLSAPFRRIHFAGSETADVSRGLMDGALQSGERAANEVLLSGEFPATELCLPPRRPPPSIFVSLSLLSLTALGCFLIWNKLERK